jgi:hypothetical protein
MGFRKVNMRLYETTQSDELSLYTLYQHSSRKCIGHWSYDGSVSN